MTTPDAALVRRLLLARSTELADVDATGTRLLLHGDSPGTRQLFELDLGERGGRAAGSGAHGATGGAMRQLTDLPEPVGAARYVPGRRALIAEIDAGGNELGQLRLIDLDDGSSRALTDDRAHAHHLAGVSPDGRLVAYCTNARNGIDFDLVLATLSRPASPGGNVGEEGPGGGSRSAQQDAPSGERRVLYDGGGWCMPGGGFSPDGRYLSFLRPGPRPLDVDLLLYDLVEERLIVVDPHPGEAARVVAPAWIGPQRLLVSSDVGRDLAAVVELDLDTGERRTLPGTGVEHDAEPYTSADGSTLLVLENRNGSDHLSLRDVESGKVLSVLPAFEPGVARVRLTAPMLTADGSAVFHTLSSPRLAGDVFAYDVATATGRRLTWSETPVPAEQLASPQAHDVASFDGERLPLFVFRPPSPEPAPGGGSSPPVVVKVHGGPEAQAQLQYDPVAQALALSGFAVVVPNVRGSTGYGRRYAGLDDTTRRLDSVADLAAVHDWLAGAGLDPDRAALWGGSYGGYMVLAGVAFQPERWAAGVDIVGISDLVTFLTNTSSYRRAHRELEYGSLERDREFLAAASPMRSVDAVRAPLFVVHGRNDPRVPVSEAEQLVERLRGNGVRCELSIYEDEGHGLQKLANRLDAYPRAIGFLADVLGLRAASGADASDR